jgi:hypothetical protein
MSPLIIALVPVGLALARSTREPISPVVNRLALAGGIGILVWMAVRPAVISPRYVLATLLLFAPVGGWAAEMIFRRANHSILKAAAFLALAYGAVLPNLENESVISAFRAGGLGQGACVGSASCPGLQHLNAVAAEGERIYFLGYYAYHLRPDLLQCLHSIEDDANPAWTTLSEHGFRYIPEWTTVIERGFRYVVVQKATHATVTPRLSVDRAPSWLNIRVIYDDESTRVFALTVTDGQNRAAVKCAQEPGPAWSVVPSR